MENLWTHNCKRRSRKLKKYSNRISLWGTWSKRIGETSSPASSSQRWTSASQTRNSRTSSRRLMLSYWRRTRSHTSLVFSSKRHRDSSRITLKCWRNSSKTSRMSRCLKLSFTLVKNSLRLELSEIVSGCKHSQILCLVNWSQQSSSIARSNVKRLSHT